MKSLLDYYDYYESVLGNRRQWQHLYFLVHPLLKWFQVKIAPLAEEEVKRSLDLLIFQPHQQLVGVAYCICLSIRPQSIFSTQFCFIFQKIGSKKQLSKFGRLSGVLKQAYFLFASYMQLQRGMVDIKIHTQGYDITKHYCGGEGCLFCSSVFSKAQIICFCTKCAVLT